MHIFQSSAEKNLRYKLQGEEEKEIHCKLSAAPGGQRHRSVPSQINPRHKDVNKALKLRSSREIK